MTKIEPEYWARYFSKYGLEHPDLTFVVKYDSDGAFYTNVSGDELRAPINGNRHGNIKNKGSFLETGETFEQVVNHNRDRYRRISEEIYVKALISGKFYGE